MKPNFFIIGAARSGTTSLFIYLENHPDIFMSEIKEINFFSNEKYWKKGLGWYEQHFSRATQRCVGEASTSYTSFPSHTQTPERIFKYQPHAKLIYIVRDPIDRFISHYLHEVTRGLEHREINDIIYNYHEDFLLTQGKYNSRLEQYLKYFPKESFHLLTIEDLKNNSVETVKSIFKFLDIDTSFPDMLAHSRHNANTKVTRKNKIGKHILNFYHNKIEQVAFPYTFKKLFLKAAEIGAIEVKPPTLDEQALNALKNYYRDDIHQLKQNTKLNLSKWRNYNTQG